MRSGPKDHASGERWTPARCWRTAPSRSSCRSRIRDRKQLLIGKLLAPFVRRKYLGDVPFPKSSPTDPAFIVGDQRSFDAEKARLLAVLARFVERGPEAATGTVHTFFGRLTGAQWGRLIYKHLDHHLRQFGV